MMSTFQEKKTKKLLVVIHSIGWAMMLTWCAITVPFFNYIFSLGINGLGTYKEGHLIFGDELIIGGNLYFGIIFIGVLFAKAGFLLSIISEKDFSR